MPSVKGNFNTRRIFRKRKVMRTMGTQVTSCQIDETFENLCHDHNSAFDIYKQQLFMRKKDKYKNIFLGGRVQKISNTTLCKPIAYQFGPLTIHKNSRYL